MRSKRGFTLVHMLVAITAIGATAAGTTQVILAISRSQAAATTRITALRDTQRLDRSLQQALVGADLRFLSGGQGHFSVPCAGVTCAADVQGSTGKFLLALSTSDDAKSIGLPGPVRFEYVGVHGISNQWPSSHPNEALLGIALRGAEQTLAFVHTPALQPRDCEYDSVIRDCRAINP